MMELPKLTASFKTIGSDFVLRSARINGAQVWPPQPTPEQMQEMQKHAAREAISRGVSMMLPSIAEHPDAPEGVELYDWRLVAWHIGGNERRARVTLERPQDGGDADRRAPMDAMGTWIEAAWSAELTLATPQGPMRLPYWVGWDVKERIAVICCGP